MNINDTCSIWFSYMHFTAVLYLGINLCYESCTFAERICTAAFLILRMVIWFKSLHSKCLLKTKTVVPVWKFVLLSGKRRSSLFNFHSFNIFILDSCYFNSLTWAFHILRLRANKLTLQFSLLGGKKYKVEKSLHAVKAHLLSMCRKFYFPSLYHLKQLGLSNLRFKCYRFTWEITFRR